jgi:hypothetical protein
VTEKLHVDYGVRVTTMWGYHPLWGNADHFDGALYNPADALQVHPKTSNVILGTGNPYDPAANGQRPGPGSAEPVMTLKIQRRM